VHAPAAGVGIPLFRELREAMIIVSLWGTDTWSEMRFIGQVKVYPERDNVQGNTNFISNQY